jgi:adenine deaminase
MTTSISGQIIDILRRRIFNGTVYINAKGRIERIEEESTAVKNRYILPPFIDAHVHIESTMMMPSEFAGVAVRFGVAGVVCDPHEIANVMGAEGIRYMIDNGKTVPFKFFFGLPSCVPVTSIETSGAVLDAAETDRLLADDDLYFLAEMMDYTAVVHRDPEVMAKIRSARAHNKPIDGHAPGLHGRELRAYSDAGITTDHECHTIEEAREKIRLGMNIQIREGSAARNFEALYPLINCFPDHTMLCTDDCHPDDLLGGYINDRVRRSIAKGLDLFNVLRAAIMNPVWHYRLPFGLLQAGDPADLIVVDDLRDFNVRQTYINGQLVFDQGEVRFTPPPLSPINRFRAGRITADAIRVAAPQSPERDIRVIEIIDKELLTTCCIETPTLRDGAVVADPERDLLKIVVLNRYVENATPAVGFVRNFGLRRGAVANTVAHDSHNVIAIGADDASIVRAINAVVDHRGGIVAVDGDEVLAMPLPIAGLLSDQKAEVVAQQYQTLHQRVRAMGSPLTAPLMTMSFLALIVIPDLKICDKGLFDVRRQCLTPLFL